MRKMEYVLSASLYHEFYAYKMIESLPKVILYIDSQSLNYTGLKKRFQHLFINDE